MSNKDTPRSSSSSAGSLSSSALAGFPRRGSSSSSASNAIKPTSTSRGNRQVSQQQYDHHRQQQNHYQQQQQQQQQLPPLSFPSDSKPTPFNNFGNDYSDHYLRTGVLPQVHVQNAETPLVGYPRLQKLHELKAMHTLQHACTPYTAAVPVPEIAPTLQKWAINEGLVFDVVMVGGCHQSQISLSTLAALPIPQLTPRPSIALVWVPSHGLDTARQALEAWGFRRSEDIVFMCRTKDSIFYPPQHPDDYIEKTSWHCLLGLKGTLRRSEDTDLINCNVDTDIIVETLKEQPNIVPEQIYSIVENFALMSRRIHIIPGHASLPVNPRPGWVIVSPDCQADNFSPSGYLAEMKTLGHRVPVDQEIEILRPKTPPRAKRNNGKQFS